MDCRCGSSWRIEYRSMMMEVGVNNVIVGTGAWQEDFDGSFR